ncbi:Ribonuclease III family protein [Trifolium repens]|nr:Ribonuclease III family protein [Trifolium repens]
MQSLSSLSSSCSITSSPSNFKAMLVKASWDSQQQQKLPYNRNAPRKLSQSQSLSLTSSSSSSSPTAPSTRKEHLISDLLKRTTPLPTIPIKETQQCEFGFSQPDALLQKLLNSNFLSDQERDVLRWGKNIVSSKTKTKKRAGAAVYNRASSLETLVGYLYLTNVNRLEKLMLEFWDSQSTLQCL